MHSSFIVHVIKAVFLELQYFLITMLQHTSIKLILISLLSLSYKTWGKKTNMTNAHQLYCKAVFLKLEAQLSWLFS